MKLKHTPGSLIHIISVVTLMTLLVSAKEANSMALHNWAKQWLYRVPRRQKSPMEVFFPSCTSYKYVRKKETFEEKFAKIRARPEESLQLHRACQAGEEKFNEKLKIIEVALLKEDLARAKESYERASETLQKLIKTTGDPYSYTAPKSSKYKLVRKSVKEAPWRSGREEPSSTTDLRIDQKTLNEKLGDNILTTIENEPRDEVGINITTKYWDRNENGSTSIVCFQLSSPTATDLSKNAGAAPTDFFENYAAGRKNKNIRVISVNVSAKLPARSDHSPEPVFQLGRYILEQIEEDLKGADKIITCGGGKSAILKNAVLLALSNFNSQIIEKTKLYGIQWGAKTESLYRIISPTHCKNMRSENQINIYPHAKTPGIRVTEQMLNVQVKDSDDNITYEEDLYHLLFKGGGYGNIRTLLKTRDLKKDINEGSRGQEQNTDLYINWNRSEGIITPTYTGDNKEIAEKKKRRLNS